MGSQPEGKPEHWYQILTEFHQVHDPYQQSQPHTQYHIHGYGTDPETQSRSTVTKQIHRQGPIHRHRTQLPSRSEIQVSHRPHTEVSHKVQNENFAKSTIRISDLSQIQGVLGPCKWIQTPRTTGRDPRIWNHRSESRDPEPLQRTSNRGTD